MKNKYFTIFMIAIIILTGLYSCSPGEPGKPNIILVVPDALRARQLPVYGYHEIETPNIDSLAKKGVVFENCFVKRASTFPSFSNLFSGLLFPRDGLLAGEKTMAEYFKENGYRTMAVVSTRMLWSGIQNRSAIRNEFKRGFDRYFQDATLKRAPYHRKNEDTTHDALTWLEENKDKDSPFFLFIHYMDPHAPHIPSYDGEVQKVDTQFGLIIKKLKELDQYENSVIIFTSDHGESLGDPVSDHGSPIGHGWKLYNEMHQIPLIIRFPGNAYVKSIPQIVRNYDLLPTLLDFLGITTRQEIDGVSLMPAVKDDKDLGLTAFLHNMGNRIYPEALLAVVFPYRNEIFKMINGRFSPYVRELYLISRDSRERSNLYKDPAYSGAARKGFSLLRDYHILFAKHFKRLARKAVPGSREERRALACLGYLIGGAPSPTITSSQFLMQQKLTKTGLLKFSGFIRHPRWGIKKGDKFFPVKIAPTCDDLVYIIAGEGRRLMEYRTREGVRPLDIGGIDDITYDTAGNRLLILVKGAIRCMDPGTGEIRKLEISPGLPELAPSPSIYTCPKGDIYLTTVDGTVKINGSGKVLAKYPFKPSRPGLLAVDAKGNVYCGSGRLIRVYDKTGVFTASFPVITTIPDVEDQNAGISIAVDSNRRLWVLNRDRCRVEIYSDSGKYLDFFLHNKQKLGRGWLPVPTRQIHISGNRVYIVDNWEGIFVYTLESNSGENL